MRKTHMRGFTTKGPVTPENFAGNGEQSDVYLTIFSCINIVSGMEEDISILRLQHRPSLRRVTAIQNGSPRYPSRVNGLLSSYMRALRYLDEENLSRDEFLDVVNTLESRFDPTFKLYPDNLIWLTLEHAKQALTLDLGQIREIDDYNRLLNFFLRILRRADVNTVEDRSNVIDKLTVVAAYATPFSEMEKMAVREWVNFILSVSASDGEEARRLIEHSRSDFGEYLDDSVKYPSLYLPINVKGLFASVIGKDLLELPPLLMHSSISNVLGSERQDYPQRSEQKLSNVIHIQFSRT